MHQKRDLFLPPLRMVNNWFSETDWKNRARASALRFRNALPRELMVRAGDTVVQVGMWRERNLRRLAQCVGSSGQVVLIEADQHVAQRMAKYCHSIGLRQVTIVNKGAWHERGTLELNVGQSAANNRLEADDVVMLGEVNTNAFAGVRTIEVDTVDNILAELGIDHVDYVEVSVNGVERQVLQGMRRTLSQVRRIFVAGYARTEQGTRPTNVVVAEALADRGLQTCISCKTPPRQARFDPEAARQWGHQDGHVFAWRKAA
ncbi:MAG: FkbM family methyltransferase [Pirellulaceae bacterium]|nr:FkbM family methyltransferase [Planctomycetales bacterium]